MVLNELELIKLGDFHNMLANLVVRQEIETKDDAGNSRKSTKAIVVSRRWHNWKHHANTSAHSVIFKIKSDPLDIPNDTLNLWLGFGIEPKQDDWSLMRNHIRDVICLGAIAGHMARHLRKNERTKNPRRFPAGGFLVVRTMIRRSRIEVALGADLSRHKVLVAEGAATRATHRRPVRPPNAAFELVYITSTLRSRLATGVQTVLEPICQSDQLALACQAGAAAEHQLEAQWQRWRSGCSSADRKSRRARSSRPAPTSARSQP